MGELAEERAEGGIRRPSTPRPRLVWLHAVREVMLVAPDPCTPAWRHVRDAQDAVAFAERRSHAEAMADLDRRPVARWEGWSVAEVAEHQARLWHSRGYPAGGQGGSPSAETWCFAHQRPSTRCTGDGCDLEAIPATGDRMGDVVAMRDPSSLLWPQMKRAARYARAALIELGHHDTPSNAQHAYGHLVTLTRLVDEAAGLIGGPAPDDLNDLTADDQGCSHCWSMGGWSPVHASNDVGGNLDAPTALCRRCHRWVTDTGRLPTLEEWEAQEAGNQVLVRKLRTKAVRSHEAAQKAKPSRPQKPGRVVNADGTTARGAYATSLRSTQPQEAP